MALALFLVPMVGTGATKRDAHHPKYTHAPEVQRYASLGYGPQEVAIAAIQAPQSYLDTVAAQPDATLMATPATIDDTLTAGQVATIKAIFEATFLPDSFVAVGDTRRQVIRTVLGLFAFSIRMHARLGDSWKKKAQDRGMTLSSRWNQFPQALKDEFQAIIETYGWTPGELGVTNQSTMREILRAIADQFAARPFAFNGWNI